MQESDEIRNIPRLQRRKRGHTLRRPAPFDHRPDHLPIPILRYEEVADQGRRLFGPRALAAMAK